MLGTRQRRGVCGLQGQRQTRRLAPAGTHPPPECQFYTRPQALVVRIGTRCQLPKLRSLEINFRRVKCANR